MSATIKQPRKEDIQIANAIDDLTLIGEISANTPTKIDKLLNSIELLISRLDSIKGAELVSRLDNIRNPALDKATSKLGSIYSAKGYTPASLTRARPFHLRHSTSLEILKNSLIVHCLHCRSN